MGFLSLLLAVLLSVSLAGCSSGGQGQGKDSGDQKKQAAKPVQISIVTGPAGGSYYPLGVGMSEIITKSVTGAKVDVVNTGGATQNATMVGTGEGDIGFTNGDTAYEAYSGTGRYAGKKLPDIRVLFAGVAGGPLHVLVPKNSGITSYSQLKGKKIAIGPQGNTTEYATLLLLKLYGVEKSDMRLSYINYDDGIQAMQDGQVDATAAVAPLPIPSVKQLATFGKFPFEILSVDDEKGKAFLKDYPYYNLVTIPADMYGLGHEVKTISSTNIVIANAKMSEETVYQITKAIFENLQTFQNAHPSGKSVKLENAPVNYIPMHPGAEKYLKEKGIIK